ncbi:MAG TPA: cytochrome c oxidase subunit 3 [Clostridia bacterium]|nr:cytochrome c oxidase subunit 3 [Clostridia bacterium]
MATLPPPFRTKQPPTSAGGGGRGPVPREPRGGGGGGRGDGDNFQSHGERLRRYRLGLFFMLVSVTMLFVSFTTLYIARRTAGRFDPMSGDFQTDWVPVTLPIGLLLINSAVLLLSSFTVEKARRAAAIEAAVVPASHIPGIAPIHESSGRWVQATALLGLAFLAGQTMAWRQLNVQGIFLDTGPASSFVFLLTGAHAVHLGGGILALIWAAASNFLHKSLDSRRVTLDVTAIYWHFLGALWIYIFALLWFVH